MNGLEIIHTIFRIQQIGVLGRRIKYRHRDELLAVKKNTTSNEENYSSGPAVSGILMN